MREFVDYDHAVELNLHRSRTWFIIHLNSAPIHWFLKRQTSVETSSFGSEFIAMKQCCEYVRGLRYKLRMMGIPIELTTCVLGDNKYVLCNNYKTHSCLKNKLSSTALNFVRKGTPKDEWKTEYINMHSNPADMLKKSLAGVDKRSKFIGYILHYID